MRKLRLYIDTSVINHLFHDDAPDRQETTIRFFENAVRACTSDFYVSYVVFDEIELMRDEARRDQLLTALAEAAPHILACDDRKEEIRQLAEFYLCKRILPAREYRDALHVAIATVYEMDALVSWNFRHLVNVNKELLFHAANTEMGYSKLLRFISPEEAIYDI